MLSVFFLNEITFYMHTIKPIMQGIMLCNRFAVYGLISGLSNFPE